MVTVVGVSHGDLEASEVGHPLPWTHTLHYLVSLAVYIDIRCLSDTYLEPPWPPHLRLVTCFDSLKPGIDNPCQLHYSEFSKYSTDYTVQ